MSSGIKLITQHAHALAFEIVHVTIMKTLSDQIKNGARGFVADPGDGLNQVNFENGTIAFCYMHELQVEQSDQ